MAKKNPRTFWGLANTIMSAFAYMRRRRSERLDLFTRETVAPHGGGATKSKSCWVELSNQSTYPVERADR